MRLPGGFRTRYSREANLCRHFLAAMGVRDIQELSDAAVHALANLDRAGRQAGMSLEQRQAGLTSAAKELASRA